ncbi:MAG: shikimate kinase [Muribaculaceae bacterium]|nr:shikimate kinase [Muribaculaceae bacterium]MDE7457290.1 shikimate kinase [Muribaculaceae bacterium]
MPSAQKRLIFLIGYMASGKTTLGRALAASTGMRFVDLDEFIEVEAGKSINDIFAEDGESGFRRLESLILRKLTATDDDNIIVACGGGTPCFGDNMEVMNQAGMTVWLTAPVEVIIRRLEAERASRPLVARLSDGDELKRYVMDNLEQRTPHYSRSKARFDSSKLECEAEIDESVKIFINRFL